MGATSSAAWPVLTTIPGIALLTEWARLLLTLAVFFGAAYETGVLILTGRCNYGGLVLRGAGAALTISFLPEIGTIVHTLCSQLGQAFDGDAHQALLGAAFKQWTSSSLKAWSAGTLGATALGLCVVPVSVIVFAMKMFLMQVIYPVVFSIAVWSGILSVPFSPMPNVNRLGDFYVRVLEKGLWPVVHAFVTALLAMLFSETLQEVSQSNLLDFWETLVQIWKQPEAALDAVSQNTLVIVGKFTGFCAMYAGLTIKTPELTRMILRNESLSSAVGMMAAGGFAVLAAGASVAAGAAGMGGMVGKFAAGSRVASMIGSAAKGLGTIGAVGAAIGTVAKGFDALTHGPGQATSHDMNARPVGGEG